MLQPTNNNDFLEPNSASCVDSAIQAAQFAPVAGDTGLGMRTGIKRLQCYAHGKPNHWEAICVDLDIAVQGTSLDEVRNSLKDAIAGYISDAFAEDAKHARALLERRAPFHVRLKLALAYFAHAISRDDDDELKAGFR